MSTFDSRLMRLKIRTSGHSVKYRQLDTGYLLSLRLKKELFPAMLKARWLGHGASVHVEAVEAGKTVVDVVVR